MRGKNLPLGLDILAAGREGQGVVTVLITMAPTPKDLEPMVAPSPQQCAGPGWSMGMAMWTDPVRWLWSHLPGWT